MASHEIESLDPAASVEKLDQTPSRAVNRRRFLAALGATGAGAALVANVISNPRAVQAAAPPYGPQQVDYLNFLLNLEYFQATLYSYITTGADLPISFTQGGGALTSPPAKVTFTGANAQQLTDMFNEMYYGDLNHVASLRNLLGNPTAISRPPMSFAVYAAINVNNVLGFARMFEDVTVTAYNGVLPFLTGSNLTLASQIVASQSEHAAMLRLACIQNPSIAQYIPPAVAGSFTGIGTSGSKTITNIYYGATLPTVGQRINGTGIPGITAITAIAGSGQNTSFTGTITTSSAIITGIVSSAGQVLPTGLAVGQLITGTGIPANATIKTVGPGATLTISAAATATTTALTITVGTGSLTLSQNVTASTTNAQFTISGVDAFDIPPFDPGSAATAAAGPTQAGGFFNTAGGTSGTTSNPSGMAFARNTSQVLLIFYSSPSNNTPAINGIAKGGYFPSGVSGIINSI